MCDKHSLAAGKYVNGFTVALLLVLPNLVWIALDKSLWKGDPCGYALGSVSLYYNMITDVSAWIRNSFGGYKAPMILWIGQFFVALGSLIGSVNFSLLLIPLISTYITLVLLFKSVELLFKNKAIAFCACLIVAASSLFNSLSTGFWIEPMQIAITTWFIYILIKVSNWSFYFALAQFITALSLAMLIKASSPLYIVGPSIAFWIIVFRGNPSMKINKKNLFLLLVSFLFFLPTAVFYVHNFHDLLGFAQYASTNPLFGSNTSKSELWTQIISNGVFQQLTFKLTTLLFICGVIITISRKAYSNFEIMFWVSMFQITLFFVAWLSTVNSDPRYFEPVLPYLAILICWALTAINNRLLMMLTVSLFLIQFIRVNASAFGWAQLSTSIVPMRPLKDKPERDRRIIHELLPLATHDSSIVFDMNPELGLVEFQYELSKQNLTGNWLRCCADISMFFHITRQQIDTSKINIDTVWKNLLAYNPDYYVTWNSRLSNSTAKVEMQRIDKYNALTVPARWAIASKVKNSGQFEIIPFPSYPELLVYKRCNVHVKNVKP